jgi:hypothetical protein
MSNEGVGQELKDLQDLIAAYPAKSRVFWSNKTLYCCEKHTSEVVSLGLMVKRYVPVFPLTKTKAACTKCVIEHRMNKQ